MATSEDEVRDEAATAQPDAADVPAPAPGDAAEAGAPTAAAEAPRVMIPARGRRPPLEAALMRIVATAGIVGISVAVAAIMGSQHSQGWLIGLVASVISVVLAAVLWSSRRV